jgi:hypothetical protein
MVANRLACVARLIRSGQDQRSKLARKSNLAYANSEDPQMKIRSITVLCCVAMMTTLAFAQNAEEGFQPARIVSFEKLAASEQHPENSDRYKMSMRLGDTLYLCQASGPIKTFMDWTINKELPAKVNGKSMLVKNFDGQLIELKIDKTKKPK